MKMKKFMAILIGVTLVSIVLTGVIPDQAEGSNTKNVDVAIVLDNSGSMDMPGKWDNATEAAKGFISKLKSGDRCCIFCFNDPSLGHDEPMMLIGFTSTNDAGIQSLNGAIDGLADPECYTPLFDTIGTAMDYVVNYKRADSVGAIVALTDGLDNVCYEFYPSHNYRENKTVNEPYGYSDWGPSDKRIGLLSCSQATFIIGLAIEDTSSTYIEQLQDIAESSSGAYYSAAEGTELSAIYNQIAEEIEGKRSEGGELPWLWILIIVIIVAVAAIIAVFLLRRKKVPMGSAPGPQQPPQQTQNQQASQEGRQTSPPTIPTCPMCGGQLRLIPQYNRHWCDGCQKYK